MLSGWTARQWLQAIATMRIEQRSRRPRLGERIRKSLFPAIGEPGTIGQLDLADDRPMNRSASFGVWIARATCLAAWAVVTVLLLVPDPSALVGLSKSAISGYSLIAHVACFFAISLLTLLSRPPVSAPATVTILMAYGATVEMLQGLVPQRTVEFRDFVANALGIAAGVAAYAAVEGCRQWRAARGNRVGTRTARHAVEPGFYRSPPDGGV